jgi:hypothetical protein
MKNDLLLLLENRSVPPLPWRLENVGFCVFMLLLGFPSARQSGHVRGLSPSGHVHHQNKEHP